MTPQLPKMKLSGKLAKETLDHITQYVVPGTTTDFIDQKAIEYIKHHGGTSACMGYTNSGWFPPYPKNICTSVNHVACHGIPNSKILKDGDSLNIDITTILDEHHGDTSRMYFVGKPSIKHQRLSDFTYDLMMKTIDMIKPGIKISDIGSFGEDYVNKTRFKILRQFSGHGIGVVFHDTPSVVNFVEPNLPDWDYVLQEGEFITVEPIVTTGNGKVKVLNDKWTTVTCDREPCAQWEHTIAITPSGNEIMTI